MKNFKDSEKLKMNKKRPMDKHNGDRSYYPENINSYYLQKRNLIPSSTEKILSSGTLKVFAIREISVSEELQTKLNFNSHLVRTSRRMYSFNLPWLWQTLPLSSGNIWRIRTILPLIYDVSISSVDMADIFPIDFPSLGCWLTELDIYKK